MTEFLLICTATIAASVYAALRYSSGPRRLYLPDSFIAMTAMHFVGALWLHLLSLSPASSFVFDLAAIALIAASTFGTMTILSARRSTSTLRSIGSSRQYSTTLLIVIAVNSLIIGTILQNGNIRTLLILGAVADEAALLTIRKIITASVDGYMGAGIIKLVRDIASPIAIAAFVLATRLRDGSPFKMPVFWVAFASVAGASYLGGQRFPIMLLLGMTLAASVVPIQGSPQSSRGIIRIIFFGILIVMGYALMSSALGRTAPSNAGLWAPITTVVSIFERVLIIVPSEAIKTYDFWSELGPTYGASWWADLSTLTPGRSENSFSNQLHAMSGGSLEGNAPLFFGADAWFAFGTLGVIISAGLAFLLYHQLDAALWRLRSPVTDASRYLLLFSIPLMYSPFLFLLNGGLIVLAVIVSRYAIAVTRQRRTTVPRAPSRSQATIK